MKASTNSPSVAGLPFVVGERKNYHGLAFTEIDMTGKIGVLSAGALGPVARVSSEYAEFIVRACNSHDQLVAALSRLLPRIPIGKGSLGYEADAAARTALAVACNKS